MVTCVDRQVQICGLAQGAHPDVRPDSLATSGHSQPEYRRDFLRLPPRTSVLAAGITLMACSPAVVGFATLLVRVELSVRLVEEPYLNATHGEKFDVYICIVGGSVPGIGRRRCRGPIVIHNVDPDLAWLVYATL